MYKLCITGDLGFEFWKDIPGYEGLYQASTYGRIKSLDMLIPFNGTLSLRKGKILALKKDKYGYSKVGLYKNRKQKYSFVHRLVAQTFIPKWNSKMCVINHKVENEVSNNRVENLEWCTVAYNNLYGTRLERANQTKSKAILQLDIQGNFIKEWPSATICAKETGFWSQNISSCCAGRHKTAYGYIWKYKKTASKLEAVKREQNTLSYSTGVTLIASAISAGTSSGKLR